MYPKLKYYLRSCSDDEKQKYLNYNPITPEYWTTLQSYEPMMYRGSYDDYLIKYHTWFEQHRKNVIPPDFSLDRIVVSDENDFNIILVENRLDFVRWTT